MNSIPSATSAAISGHKLASDIGYATAKKVIDAAKFQGEASVELIKGAAKIAQQAQRIETRGDVLGVVTGGASPEGVGARIDLRG